MCASMHCLYYLNFDLFQPVLLFLPILSTNEMMLPSQNYISGCCPFLASGWICWHAFIPGSVTVIDQKWPCLVFFIKCTLLFLGANTSACIFEQWVSSNIKYSLGWPSDFNGYDKRYSHVHGETIFYSVSPKLFGLNDLMSKGHCHNTGNFLFLLLNCLGINAVK